MSTRSSHRTRHSSCSSRSPSHLVHPSTSPSLPTSRSLHTRHPTSREIRPLTIVSLQQSSTHASSTLQTYTTRTCRGIVVTDQNATTATALAAAAAPSTYTTTPSLQRVTSHLSNMTTPYAPTTLPASILKGSASSRGCHDSSAGMGGRPAAAVVNFSDAPPDVRLIQPFPNEQSIRFTGIIDEDGQMQLPIVTGVDSSSAVAADVCDNGGAGGVRGALVELNDESSSPNRCQVMTAAIDQVAVAPMTDGIGSPHATSVRIPPATIHIPGRPMTTATATTAGSKRKSTHITHENEAHRMTMYAHPGAGEEEVETIDAASVIEPSSKRHKQQHFDYEKLLGSITNVTMDTSPTEGSDACLTVRQAILAPAAKGSLSTATVDSSSSAATASTVPPVLSSIPSSLIPSTSVISIPPCSNVTSQSELDGMTKKLYDEQNRTIHAQQEVKQLKELLRKKADECQQWLGEIRTNEMEYQREINVLKNQLKNQTSELSDSKDEVAGLDAKLKKARQLFNDVQQRLMTQNETLEKEKSDAEKKFQQQCDSFKRDYQQLQTQLQESNQRVSSVQLELHDTRQRLQVAQEEKTKAAEQLKKSYDELVVVRDGLMKSCEEANSKVQHQTRQCQQLEEKLKLAQERQLQAEQQRDAFDRKSVEVRLDLAESQQKGREAEQQINQLQEEIKSLKSRPVVSPFQLRRSPTSIYQQSPFVSGHIGSTSRSNSAAGWQPQLSQPAPCPISTPTIPTTSAPTTRSMDATQPPTRLNRHRFQPSPITQYGMIEPIKYEQRSGPYGYPPMLSGVPGAHNPPPFSTSSIPPSTIPSVTPIDRPSHLTPPLPNISGRQPPAPYILSITTPMCPPPPPPTRDLTGSQSIPSSTMSMNQSPGPSLSQTMNLKLTNKMRSTNDASIVIGAKSQSGPKPKLSCKEMGELIRKKDETPRWMKRH